MVLPSYLTILESGGAPGAENHRTSPLKNIYLLLFGYLEAPSQELPSLEIKIIQHNKAWLSSCYIAARREILKKWTSS